MMRILVAGGAGFIGSNFIRHLLLHRADVEIVNLDKLTYAGNLENLADLQAEPRLHFLRGDIADDMDVANAFAKPCDVVINFAAETHVDRSIHDAQLFLRTNVIGTQVLLQASIQAGVKRFIQISTDEVYGSAPAGESLSEEAPLDPSSPYSASKAAADLLLLAYRRTFGLRMAILRCTNNYGPYQFPEKLIPLMIMNALADRPLPVYGDGMQERDWLFVEDHCSAIRRVLETESAEGIYNVSSGAPTSNLLVVREILRSLGKPESLIQHVTDRPGHDRRYALDSRRFQQRFGWRPQVDFAEGIQRTIRWYVQNQEWLAHTQTGEYQRFYELNYAQRSAD
jgi:dTDP-glucose 4,6-dehydratase